MVRALFWCPIAVTIFALGVPARPLAQATQNPTFEVAAVRLSAPGTRSVQTVTETRVDLINIPLRSVLLMAFKVGDLQLAAPDWTADVRIDVRATVPAGATRAQVPAMLQSLLAERLGLATHVESRPIDVQVLAVGDTGASMREVQAVDELSAEFTDLGAPATPALDRTFDTIDGRTRSMMLPLGMRTVTARTRYDRFFTANRTTRLEAARMTMAELATILSSTMDEPVVDRTGLTGLYQFTVTLPPDGASVRRLLSAGISTTVQGTPLTEPTGVSVHDAVEGLGLKIEKRRTPLDVVVVDRLERTPREN